MNTYRTRIAAPEELEHSHGDWTRLVLAMAAPTVFCTWEWVFEWWKCFASGNRQLLILFITAGEELKGIVPLFRHSGLRTNSGWAYGRILEYCGSRDLFADQVDIICAPADIEPCAEALNDFLQTDYTGWDVWDVPLVRSESALAACVRRMTAEGGGGRATTWNSVSHAPYIVPRRRSFDDYASATEKTLRYDVRRRSRWMTEKGLRYAIPDPGTETAAVDTLFALHAARAQQKKLKSTFDDTQVRRFHEAFARKAAQNGWLWLRELRSGSSVLATFYGFEIGERVYYFNSGFDPAWEKFTPGKMIIDGVLREAFAKNCLEFNFLQGDERYKSAWTRDKHGLFSGFIYNRSALGTLNRVAANAKSVARHMTSTLRIFGLGS